MKQFCMKIDLISQRRENVLVLPSNMVAMTKHENALQPMLHGDSEIMPGTTSSVRLSRFLRTSHGRESNWNLELKPHRELVPNDGSAPFRWFKHKRIHDVSALGSACRCSSSFGVDPWSFIQILGFFANINQGRVYEIMCWKETCHCLFCAHGRLPVFITWITTPLNKQRNLTKFKAVILISIFSSLYFL